MFDASHVSTLDTPQAIFTGLAIKVALWAGVPGVAVIAVIWLLNLYNNIKSWAKFGASVVETGIVVKRNIRARTTEQQRELGRLLLYSVLVVVFSYMVAEIANVVVHIQTADPYATDLSKTLALKQLEAAAASVTPWPSAVVWTVVIEVAGIGLLGVACIAELKGLLKLVTYLGVVLCVLAWLAVFMLSVETGIFALVLLASKMGPSDPTIPPLAFVVTCAVTVGLCLGVALSLPKLRGASAKAFGSR